MRQEQDRTDHTRRRGVAAAVVASVVLGMAAAVLPAPALAATNATPRRIVTGWLPYWSSASSTASVVANADLFTDVSPFWYSAQGTGANVHLTQQVSDSSKATYLPQLHAAGIRVLPTITDGTGSHGLATIMADPTNRARFVSRIVSLVTSNGYDGIDLDFEGFAFDDGSATWATTRPAWVAFVTALGAALHAQGKLLSVTTPYLSSPTTGYWVYDWAGIGPAVDRLRVMTYDYHVSVAGPIAPFPWVDSVARFAITQVPAGKVQIGVAGYGRDWKTGVSYTGAVASCPTVAPAGATANQWATLQRDLSWASYTHTFSASEVPSYLANLQSANFAVPGVSVVTAPAVTWDATYRERTFSSAIRFSGQRQQSLTTQGAGPAGATTITVGSPVGLAPGLVVGGTGIAAGTTVIAVNPTTKVVTLSTATTGAVSGSVSFNGLIPVSCTVTRTAWYDDGSAAAARAALVGTYHLGGIAQWAIGGEDPAQWAKLRSYALTIAPTPTVVRLSAPAVTTFNTPAAVSATVTAAGLPVQGVTATLQAQALGSTRWVTLDQQPTSATGTASFYPVMRGATRYRTLVPGSYDRTPGSAATTAGARTAVSLAVVSPLLDPGHSSRVVVHLAPGRRGQVVQLQLLVAGRWRTIATRSADRFGHLTFYVAPTGAHTVKHYRLAAQAIAGVHGGTGVFGLTVR